MQQPSNQYLSPEEAADVNAALLDSSEKFLTRLTISSLRLLTVIAKEIDVPIEKLSHEQIITWFENDSKKRRELGSDEATLKW